MADASGTPHVRRSAPWAIGIGVLYVLLCVVYAWLGMWRYHIFRAGVDDGIFTQIVDSSFKGFASTQEAEANHLLVHFSPILVTAWPFVKIFGGAPGLIVLQALLTAAVLFPVWGIASRRLPKPIAFFLAVVAATYPPLSGEAIGDFHELAFAPVLCGCLVWALDRRAWRWALLSALLLACVKEDQFVSLAFIGLFIALTSASDRELRRCGVWILTLAVVFAAGYFAGLRPLLNPAFPYWSFHYYQWWWSPPTPNGFVTWDSPVRLQYALAAFAPLAFLPFLSRRYLPFVIPGFAEVMLSHEAITLFIGLHYSATWSGYMLAAFADGAGRLSLRSLGLTQVALGIALVVSIWTSVYYSPTMPGYFLARAATDEDRGKEAMLASLPDGATIYSNDRIFAHLGTQPQASVNLAKQEYLVFDVVEDAALFKSDAVQGSIARGEYRVVSTAHGLVVLRRRVTSNR